MEHEGVSATNLYTLVPVALAYGGFNGWMLFRKSPMRLCKTLRYLLGYWVGSILYVLICVVFPILLALSMVVAYYFP
jgi:hypothetical protein